LVRELIAQGAKVTCHDPYLNYWNELGITIPKKLPFAANFDAVIFAVQHQQYKDLDLDNWANSKTIILDANWVFNKDQRKTLRAKGIRIESIGRGNGL
jgi:UDP-N-acetyl-D-mannosaminuronate dehydrogenase